MQEQARSIAGQLYDGILSQEDWFCGTEVFKTAVGCTNFHHLTVDLQQGRVLESLANINDAKALEDYEQHYALTDERLPVVMRLGQGQVLLDHEHFSERQMSRSAVYTDCLAPQGLKYTMGLMLRVEGSVHQYVALIRALDRPHFSRAERDFALHLLPDMMSAARLRSRADNLARCASLGLAALDTLPKSVLVVDAHCRIHYSNRAADNLLGGSDALRVRHGRLQCDDGLAQAQLQRHVARACGVQGAGMAGVQSLAGKHQRLGVTMLPLKASHVAAAWQRPMALVVLTDPAAPNGLNASLISEMLGLSAKEASLALALATGKTVKDFAGVEGCSWHTARTHLRNLMRKTGCHRQAELVLLLQSLRME